MARVRVTILALVCLLSARLLAHPGTGIVVDRIGQIYFVDMVSGIWKLDSKGALTHIPGPAFHWMALDANDGFARVRLPSGSRGDVVRLGANPAVLLASDFPIAIGRDGSLHYPTHAGAPVEIMKLTTVGQTSSRARLPAATSRGSLTDLNGLAAGPDDSLVFTEDDAIRRIDKAGQISTVAESVSVPGCASKSPILRGLDVGTDGTIVVAATGCKAVLTIASNGRIAVLPQVSNPWAPTGIALFGKDVYVLEFQNGESDDRREMVPRVRRIAADGKTAVVVTVTR
jgi:hypothetical protein